MALQLACKATSRACNKVGSTSAGKVSMVLTFSLGGEGKGKGRRLRDSEFRVDRMFFL